jgi:hypothetical protein
VPRLGRREADPDPGPEMEMKLFGVVGEVYPDEQ